MPNRVTYFTSLLILFFLKGLISWIYLFLNSVDYLYRLLICCGDVELNPGPARSCHMGRVLFSNIRGLYKNLKDLIATSQSHDVVICAETLVSDFRHDVELKIPGFCQPLLIRRDLTSRRRGMSIHIREGFSAHAHRKTKYECGCHEFVVVRFCAQFQNVYIFGAVQKS